MKNYEAFMAQRPRLASALAIAGLASMLLGLSGVPSDIENWGVLFQSIGSNVGRWILVLAGLGAMAIWISAWKSKEETSSSVAPQLRSESNIKDSVVREIVVLIDDWRTIRTSEFGETPWSVYETWRKRTGQFITAVIGDKERQIFERNEVKPRNSNESVDLRIKALEQLRDNPDKWSVSVNEQELQEAIKQRRHLSAPDQIAIATSPIVETYLPSSPASEEHKDVSAEGQEDMEIEAEDDLVTALRRERNHGQQLLHALGAGFAEIWKYHRPAKGSDVEGWEANVDHLLRDQRDLKRLFHYEPLEPAIAGLLPSLHDALLHGPERRRLKQRLHQLDLVLERL